MSEPCGCKDREGHASPWVDVELGLFHGERNLLCGDPGPYGFCLCGHPEYLSCPRAMDIAYMELRLNEVAGNER